MQYATSPLEATVLHTAPKGSYTVCVFFIFFCDVVCECVCRARSGLHRLPSCSGHDAHASGVVSVFLHHDYSAWTG